MAKHYDGIVGGPREVRKEDICPEEEEHCTLHETINWNGRGGNYPHAACFWVQGGLLRHCGKARLLGTT